MPCSGSTRRLVVSTRWATTPGRPRLCCGPSTGTGSAEWCFRAVSEPRNGTAQGLNSDWSGHLVQAVHGPADLTWPQAAEIVGAAVGRPVRVERVDDEVMRGMLQEAGMSANLVDAVLGMSTGLRDGFVPEQSRTVITTTDTTLAAWSYAELRPQLLR